MDSIIVLAVIAAIITGVIAYIRKEKKKGVKCIGCPDAQHCSGHCSGCKGCGNK